MTLLPDVNVINSPEVGTLAHYLTPDKKIYVIDSSVLIQSPYAMFAFDEHAVVIPDKVISKISTVEKGGDTVSINAHIASVQIEKLSQRGNISKGIDLSNIKDKEGRSVSAGFIMVATDQTQNIFLPNYLDKFSTFYRVAEVVKSLEHTHSKNEVILISDNIGSRIKARTLGIKAESYASNQQMVDNEFTGINNLSVPKHIIDKMYDNKRENGSDACYISLKEIRDELGNQGIEYHPNEYVILKSDSQSIITRCDGRKLISIKNHGQVYGVSPLNSAQSITLDALLRPASECPLVIIRGGAGTAKTFLSLAAGLEQVVGIDSEYKRMLVARPNIKFSDTVGFLKGGEEEKIAPLIRPIMDNLDQLTAMKDDSYDDTSWNAHGKSAGKKKRPKGQVFNSLDNDDDNKYGAPNSYAQDLFESGKIVAQAMEYMRGRSIADTYIIIDEAQNINYTQAFGIISRSGNNTKIVMVGDPNQIDDPHLNKTNNGLSLAAAEMLGSSLCTILGFTEEECVRSPLAKEVIGRMGCEKGKEVAALL